VRESVPFPTQPAGAGDDYEPGLVLAIEDFVMPLRRPQSVGMFAINGSTTTLGEGQKCASRNHNRRGYDPDLYLTKKTQLCFSL
jgi:hypothetical protein